MAKGRYSRFPSRKSSSSTFILTMLIVFTFVIIVLLALGILYIPSSSADSSRKANDLSNIIHNKMPSFGGDDGTGERWEEVISWEPRDFIYHNFLEVRQLKEKIGELTAELEKTKADNAKLYGKIRYVQDYNQGSGF